MNKIIILIGSIFFLAIACDSSKFELEKPENPQTPFSESSFFEKTNPNATSTTVTKNATYNFVLQLNEKVAQDENIILNSEDKLEKIVAEYNKFKSANDYLLLPKEYFTFSEKIIKKGNATIALELKIKEYDNLTQGNYVLPLNIEVQGKSLLHLVVIRKDAEYVAISEKNRKPMPSGEYDCPDRKAPMKLVAYVETNDYDIRNMGQFILKDSKKPVFDMVVLFAANMNYDAQSGKRILYFNDKLQPILKDPEKYIKPLTDRGIKVIIDILPNHQGVGYANFQSYEEALEFAKECKNYADKLGIDGWDIDEEYAQYHKLPEKPVVGTQSYFWYMKAMKEVMPDKLLTLYDYGHSITSDYKDEDEKYASDYLDYSWANYGENHGSRAGLPENRYGKLSIEANWSLNSCKYYAKKNIQDCYGLFMFFNINGSAIKNGSAASSLSEVTQIYYGEECVFSGKYHKGPKDN